MCLVSPWITVALIKLTGLSNGQEILRFVMKPDGSLLRSKKPDTLDRGPDWTLPTASHPMALLPTLILSTHLRLDVFSSRFPTKNLARAHRHHACYIPSPSTLYSVHDRSNEVATEISTKQKYQLHTHTHITTGIYMKTPHANHKELYQHTITPSWQQNRSGTQLYISGI
jgi:hypothetical protein